MYNVRIVNSLLTLFIMQQPPPDKAKSEAARAEVLLDPHISLAS
jgi:hypothetical protein